MAASRVRQITVAVAYVLGVAAFCEGVARLALALPSFARRVEGRDDASWRRRWLARQEQQAGGVYYGFDVHHPVRGWAVRPNVRDLVVFGDRVLNTNSAGARGVREHVQPKPPGVLRILVFGDSFTFGDEASDDETYAHALGELLPGVEVVNLGVHGYGHDQMLLYLREVGAGYQPDVVLLGFVADDMERNLLGFRDFAKPRFVLRGGRLELRGTPVPTPAEALAQEWRRSRLLEVFGMLHNAWLWRSGRAQEQQQALTLAILDEFRAEVERLGARPAYVYLPVYGEISKADMAMTRRERFFFAYCRERGIQSMYLRPFFLRRQKAGASFKTFGHWSALEHRVAAEGIRAYLLEKGLVASR
jgi:hypothetical protein